MNLQSEIQKMVKTVKRDRLEERTLKEKLETAVVVVQETRKHVEPEPRESYSLKNILHMKQGELGIRGFAVKYRTLADAEIRSIPPKLLVKNEYFMYWVAKSTRKVAMQWGQEQGFEYKQSIYWIKRSRRGKLQMNTGSLIHSAVEELLVFRRGLTPVTQRMLFFGSDVIESPRQPNSTKPDEVKRRIQKLSKKGHFLELFARNGTVKAGWIALGIDLSYTTDVSTMGYGLKDSIWSNGVETWVV
eukprot:augustus_masked-scaffold_10-processed-gene-5.67-mRNA-1 protein AED:1.00 eAED:1.00 QI:0/0/0/0/1/1/2/0/244